MEETKEKAPIIKRAIDYRGTLEGIPVGETLTVKLIGDVRAPFTQAACRLKKKMGYVYKLEKDSANNTLSIKRIS